MSDPAPTDIAALIERANVKRDFLRRTRGSDGNAAKRPGPNSFERLMEDVATALAAQQAEIERLRARLECDGTNMAGERVSVEPYDGIAVRDVMIADLRADLAARDETIRGLRERIERMLQHLGALIAAVPPGMMDDVLLRARATLKSTEPSDAA